jgi:bacterioferritin
MRYHDRPSAGSRIVARSSCFPPTTAEALMKGDPNIVRLLNAQLTNELSAINQYFLHARMYQHWGLEKIGKKEYDESIGEMKHAD